MSKEDSFEEEFPSLKVKVKDGVVCPNCGEKHLRSPKNSIVWTSEVRECCVDKQRLQDVIEKAKNTVRDSDSFDTGWKGALNMIEVELGL